MHACQVEVIQRQCIENENHVSYRVFLKKVLHEREEKMQEKYEDDLKEK